MGNCVMTCVVNPMQLSSVSSQNSPLNSFVVIVALLVSPMADKPLSPATSSSVVETSLHGRHNYVEPSGSNFEDGAYTIHFQVWRPSPTVGSDGAGCYSLVGENRFTSITFSNRGPISETPEPTNIISVQPGDVVGYYVLSNRGGDGGIQMDSGDDSIAIHYNQDNGGNPISLGPDSCQVSAGLDSLLTISTSAAPQLSIDISK